MASLTSADRAMFAEQGYLLVRGRIPAPRIHAMAAVIDNVVDEESRSMFAAGDIRDLAEDQPFDRRWFHVWRQHGGKQRFGQVGWHSRVFSRALFDLWVEPAILDAIESLLGPDVQVNGDYWVRPKLPDKDLTTLPWHQDSAYMPDTAQYHWPAVWLPLVPVTAANGAMQLLPGTHRLPIQPHERVPGVAFNTPSVDPARSR